MEKEKAIQTGMNLLLEKRLDVLSNAIEYKDEIVREVDNYIAVERIAENEGLNISSHNKRYSSLIKKFWEIKQDKEN